MSCNHLMCDLCGGKQCYSHISTIRPYGDINTCDSCLRSAVKTVYEFSCRWGGTIIDPQKPCGLKKKVSA